MTENAERYTGRVAEYTQFRERYDPKVVLPPLRKWCGLTPQWVVADIGAGTGMLSDIFLENGNRVLAIEPNEEMRAACERLHEGNALLQVMNGTAEATGLANASVDAVSAGRAFHWFALDPALREFRRILKPGGWVILVAFGRSDEGRSENVAFEELLRPYTPNGAGTRACYGVYKQLEEIFAGGEFHQAEITGEMRLDWSTLRGLAQSLSHVPLPDTARFAEFERALREYFAQYEDQGVITLSTGYWINAGRFVSSH